MGYDIVRLVAPDWPRAVAALRERGPDFYWHARDSFADDIDVTRIPFVAEYEGPLANCAGRRDPEASDLYDRLRPALRDDARAPCDAVFERLFWRGRGDEALQRDVGAAGPIADLWNALAPPTVVALVDAIDALPWLALDEAVAPGGRWESRYLPTFGDFEQHVHNHRMFLAYARKRDAGVLALVSA